MALLAAYGPRLRIAPTDPSVRAYERGFVVIDDKYYGAAEIAKSFGVDVAFTLPDSPKHAKIFSEGHQLTKFQRTQSRYLRNLDGAWPKMQTYVEEHRPEWVNPSRNQTLPSKPSTREALGESS
jgi:hypothetical protein